MTRSAAIIERLTTEEAEHPGLPHYDCKPDVSCWPLQPDDVKTAGYWKKEGRRVPKGGGSSCICDQWPRQLFPWDQAAYPLDARLSP